ncbi:MAG: peptide-methionine (S)-S-oxide reductase MsrA, partial [Christensenellales bacterium]
VEYAPTTLSGEDISFIDPTYVQRDGESVIYLAGGCFFGLESLMQQIDGVNSAVSGYANGDTVSPGYRDVASGLTGHRETVRVEYDPDVVSLDKLLYAYFAAIDPEQVNRQGHDVGTQYQSGIYYVDSASRGAVNAAADAQREQHSNFAVEIAPLTCFYPAEDYYQDYLEKNPGGYRPIDSDVFDRILSEVNG